MNSPIVADTGGLLRALARRPEGGASFPEYEAALTSASRVSIPALVLADGDYFLREDRSAMRTLVAEVFDEETRYEYECPLPSDLVRGLEFDAKFKDLGVQGPRDGAGRRTVAAVAERRQIYRILTTDGRDFGAMRVGPPFTRVTRALELVP